jgi:hypothetical protein
MDARAKTHFDALTWGMTIEEVLATLGPTAIRRPSSIGIERSIGHLSFEVTFRFADGALMGIDVGGLDDYQAQSERERDHGILVEWVSASAGLPSEEYSTCATWLLPGTKIDTYCDESLGASFVAR